MITGFAPPDNQRDSTIITGTLGPRGLRCKGYKRDRGENGKNGKNGDPYIS